MIIYVVYYNVDMAEEWAYISLIVLKVPKTAQLSMGLSPEN